MTTLDRIEHESGLRFDATPANIFDLMAGCRLEGSSGFIETPGTPIGRLASRIRRLGGKLVRFFRS